MPSKRQIQMENAEVVLRLAEFVEMEQTFRDVARLIDISYTTTDVGEKQKVLKQARDLLKQKGY